MCIAAGRSRVEPLACPAAERSGSRFTRLARKHASGPLGLYGHGPRRADDLRQFLPEHVADGPRRAELILGKRQRQLPGNFAIMLDECFIPGIAFWFLKQSLQPGSPMDRWTLCVRGDWRTR